MEQYLNLSGKSAIISYEYGADYIRIKFKGGSIYSYTFSSAGQINVENMIELAKKGYGLSSYVNKYCKYGYQK